MNVYPTLSPVSINFVVERGLTEDSCGILKTINWGLEGFFFLPFLMDTVV